VDSHKTYNFANVEITISDLSEVAGLIRDYEGNARSHFHLIAASTFYGIKKDSKLRDSLKNGVNLCDSKPLSSWLTLRGASCPQIRGTDLFREVLRTSDSETGHFLIGTTDENLSRLVAKVQTEYPQAKISGVFAPPFTTPTESEINAWAKIIKDSGAEIVWLSLGSPKQDIVAAKLIEVAKVRIVAVGAAFDFLSGNKKEAPDFIQRLHLEWLFRFVEEPKRLWKRYTIGNAQFISLVIKDLFSKNS